VETHAIQTTLMAKRKKKTPTIVQKSKTKMFHKIIHADR
jgi:hypothetical protein